MHIIAYGHGICSAVIKVFITRIATTKTGAKNLKTPLVHYLPMYPCTVDVKIKVDHLKEYNLPRCRCECVNILCAGGFNISGANTRYAIGYFFSDGNGELIGWRNTPNFK